MQNFKTSILADKIEGQLYGPDIKISAKKFTFLNQAEKDDIVIRHRINGNGIKMAYEKGVSCLITQTPQEDAITVAEELNFPLIVTSHIEYSTAFALKNSIKNYANDAFKVAVTGTNGKSTTTHILYTIFSELFGSTYTNTDAESEGNTLIDPRVSSELYDFYQSEGKINAIALEVSEVQGWDDNLMQNHAYQMINAINTDAAIITNVSFDHMNLVGTFDVLLDEISGAAKALNNQDKKSVLVLNYEDENIRQMSNVVENNPNVDVMYFGNYDSNNILDISYKEGVGIYSKDELYVEEKDLPFTSAHFIQDIMAALAVCEYNSFDSSIVINSLKNYKPLARRFIKLRENPVIIDDFAHNPSGINLTIENGSKLGDKVFVVMGIRGSRGDDINEQIATSLSETLSSMDDYTLIITCSKDVVNNLNTVLDSELKIFEDTLKQNNIQYILTDELEEALLKAYDLASSNDVILLLGAQGMDPASGILSKNNII